MASYAKYIVNVTISKFKCQTSSIAMNDNVKRPTNEPT